jgi:predicted esterase
MKKLYNDTPFINKKKDVSNAELQSQLAQKAKQSDLDLQKSRIDNLATLTNGSTTGDAELIDGRLGADGITYSNVGGAIRGQLNTANRTINGRHVNITLPFSSGNLIGAVKMSFPSTTYNTIQVKFDVKNLVNVNQFSILQGSTESTKVSVTGTKSLDLSVSGSNTSANYVYIKFYCTTYAASSFDFENLQILINGVDITSTITEYLMDFSTGGSTSPYTNIFYGIVRRDELTNNLAGKANASPFTSDANITDSVTQKTVGRINGDGSINTTQTSWMISDYIDLTYGATVNAYALNNNPALVIYDSNKNIKTIVSNSSGTDGFVTRTLSLADGAYVRIQSCPGLSKYAYGTQKVLGNFVKTGYSSGYTYFKVNVNTVFPTDTTTNAVLDSENMNYVWCALKLPTTYQATGAPTKLAVCMHGAGGVVYNGNAGELTTFENLVSAGYAILDCAGVVGDVTTSGGAAHMGGSVALQAYLKAVDYVMKNYNVENKIYLHGHSMGGLAALNFAIQKPEIVKVVGCFYPVTDLYNQAWLHSWFGTQTKVDMANAYNFVDKTGATYEADKVIGFNPIQNHSFVGADSKRYNFFPVPLKVWHGNADTVVDYTGSQTLITAIKNSGGRALMRIVDGVDHTPVSVMVTEQLYWFNRF